MTQSKTILIPTLVSSLLVLAGCTTQTTTSDNTNSVVNTNTDTAVNTNVTNDNSNEVVTNSNENTNSDQESVIDTSDWLTYTNEEYGFSFRYPGDWVLEESDRNSCVGLLTKERYTERTQLLDQIKKDSGGTDAVPGNYITVCLQEKNVTTDVITWGESNVKKYVDETYRGESKLNTLTAYLVIDLDFGESKNYYHKSVDGSVYSVYYTVEKSEIDDEIIKIIKSLKF